MKLWDTATPHFIDSCAKRIPQFLISHFSFLISHFHQLLTSNSYLLTRNTAGAANRTRDRMTGLAKVLVGT